MLEQLLIFTRGGLILWSCKEIGVALKGSPIDTFISSCLLEQRGADRFFNHESYTLKWTFHNDLGLVFVAVYQQFLRLLYVDELLALVKREFSSIFTPGKRSYREFDDSFRQLLKEAQARAEANRGLNKPYKQIAEDGDRNGDLRNSSITGGDSGKSNTSSDDDGGDAKGETNGDSNEVVANGKTNHAVKGSTGVAAFDRSKLQKLKGKGVKKSAPAPVVKKEDPKKRQLNRIRAPSGGAADAAKLDFTSKSDGGAEVNEEVVVMGKSLVDVEEEEFEVEEEEEEEGVNVETTTKKGWFSSVFSSITGKAVVEKADLETAMKALKDRLMAKNVAAEISENICESVAASLIGKKLGTFTRVSSAVKGAMREALLRILTPKRSIDILRDVQSAKEDGRPYVIVFVGVNGVGKSTNLAKVAYWLLNHEYSVMMAACDTFRSGAVEQLRTHARRLNVSLFEKGYERDPAAVAKEAIAEAVKTKKDVVLVDTAGRMQDNEPLMRALANLININKPNLVLFVGEALVGNEAVDQLSKFNQKLSDLSTTAARKMIDGVLLTKFDTIDDKVGAALSMVYISGAPIMFVGCGQSYQDLSRFNVKSIVETLLQ